jgi:hypothetical protein
MMEKINIDMIIFLAVTLITVGLVAWDEFNGRNK